MRAVARHRWIAVLGAAVIVLSSCATRSAYRPVAATDAGFMDRAVSETQAGVRVTVAVPTPEEARELFAFKLGKKGLQAVWVEVANDSESDYWFMPHALDRDYYSALEVAWMGRTRYTRKARGQMERSLHARAMPLRVPAGRTVSGFTFVNQILGARHVLIELVGDQQEVLSFDFLVKVPTLDTDYEQVDFEALYPSFEDLDPEGLRHWLEQQPATVTNQKKSALGDPLNIVVVGSNEAVWPAFVRAGWQVTETMSASSVWKTVASSLFRRRYLYSPISPLYLWGRPQDIALQKARATVDERNHLRLWLAPVTCNGELVWLGQISRDIGVRFTTKSPTISTHKIDPDVDETRSCLLQELIYAQGVSAFAFVKGVGAAPIDAPRGNLTGDPYFTDGLRIVLFLSADRVAVDQLDFIEWEVPPA